MRCIPAGLVTLALLASTIVYAAAGDEPESAPTAAGPESAPAVATPESAAAPEEPVRVEAEEEPKATLFADAILVLTLQRIGALLELSLGYRHRLYDSKSFILEDNYVGFGLLSQSSPVFTHTGVYAEIQPATFFRLRGVYQSVAYFPAFNSMLPLEDCSDIEDETLCDFDVPLGPRMDKATADFGHRLMMEARVRAKVGPVIATNSFTLERWWYRESWAAGDGYSHWYNELHYLPQKRADTAITNAGALLLEILKNRGGSKPYLMVGVSSRLAYAFGTRYLTHRVGPIGIFAIPAWKGLRDLTVVLMAAWYTHDKYKGGKAFPFLGLVIGAATKNLL